MITIKKLFLVLIMTAPVVFLFSPAAPAEEEKAQQEKKERSPFCYNVIGPEMLLPLKSRGIIRLNWLSYRKRTRFTFKPEERPIYRIFISPEGIPARKGRVHVTYDTSYPFTNLEAGKKYKILVDVEQNNHVIIPEKTYQAQPIGKKVKWYVAPRAAGGHPQNPGTYSRPVDTSFVNASAGPGDIIVLKSGVYFSPAVGANKNIHDQKLHPLRSGSPGAHILFLAESNDVSKKHRVSFQTAWGNIYVNQTDYVVFDGINCDSDQGQNAKALTAILGEYGHRPFGVIVRNIYYQAMTADKQLMMNAAREALIENCYFSGSMDSHNAYLCNNTNNRPEYSDSRAIFRNNICMNATRNNVHANGFFDNFIIENNIMTGAKVSNISLATVHRNSHVRNNIAYDGAKQAITLNFYHSGAPLEAKQPSANIHICHNTLIVSEYTDYPYAPIIISDTRLMPNRHTIEGLHIKNNILVTRRKSSRNVLLNLMQSRHLNRMEVSGNLGYSKGDQWGYFGEVGLPSSGEPSVHTFAALEENSREGTPMKCTDSFRDGNDKECFDSIDVKLGRWQGNRMAEELESIFKDPDDRDYRLTDRSPATGIGLSDREIERIVRDIFGNIRNHAPGKLDAGAVVNGSKRGATLDPSELRLLMPDEQVTSELVPGVRTLVAAAKLEVRTPKAIAFQNAIIQFEVGKRNQNGLIDVNKNLLAEVEVNGRRKRLAFFKTDKPGYEKFWTDGWATALALVARDEEILDLKVYMTIVQSQNVAFIKTTIAHDNLWGYDARGRKIAVTKYNEIGFSQTVK
ncbi:MAG: right-handed parallel beta-helix repeat-containing protein [Planctomycetota bacterium]